jgi:hypothetical protein
MNGRSINGNRCALVRLSEIHSAAEVLTLDSDFRIYRRHGNKVIPLRMPD